MGAFPIDHSNFTFDANLLRRLRLLFWRLREPRRQLVLMMIVETDLRVSWQADGLQSPQLEELVLVDQLCMQLVKLIKLLTVEPVGSKVSKVNCLCTTSRLNVVLLTEVPYITDGMPICRLGRGHA